MSQTGSVSRLMASPAFKFIILGVLTLVLMIPLLMVYLIVDERERYSRQAATEVGRSWGRAQSVSGPYMVIPLVRTIEKTDRQGVKSRYKEQRYVTFLPAQLNLDTNVEAKELKRGIFSIPVYKSDLKFSGNFMPLDTSRLTRDQSVLRYEDAALILLLSDVRGIKKTTTVKIGDIAKTFQAGIGFNNNRVQGIHIPLSEAEITSGFNFNFDLPVNGTKYLKFEPSGGETKIAMRSDWAHPSFTGNFLPSKRSISNDGFSANWDVPQLARGQGQLHINTRVAALMPQNLFGVQLYQPIGFYDLVSRALKYAIAFIGTAFLLVFIMEVYVGRPVHWIQYVFVGFALLIFYLVLLGMAEHIGFEISYGLASIATSLLIGLYTASALKSTVKGLTIGTMLLLIYGLLYLLLRVEDYALLIGSLTSFFMLAVLMFMTRNVDWSGYEREGDIKSP